MFSSIFKKININYVVIGVLIIIIIFMYRCNNQNKTLIEKFNQNQKALNDSIRISKNKIGELEFSKNILISNKNELVTLNKSLDDELKKTKGKVSELNKMIIKLTNPPMDLPTDVTHKDSIYTFTWSKDTIFNEGNSRKIKGETIFKALVFNDSLLIRPIKTTLLNDEINFSIIQGLREKDGNLEVFVRSNYPGFELKDLSSVIINPDSHPLLKKFTNSTKPKYFGIGINVGYGLNKDGFSPQIGVGLHYNIIRF